MERNQVSIHEVRVFLVLRDEPRWVDANTVAQKAKVSPRTARAHLRRLTQLGVVDMAQVFPGHRYRYAEKAEKRNATYVQRLEGACEAFGICAGA